ncbi:transcription factor S [Candidatus Pacearchaeota archaeon]|nr:transcription factor S [Candidatus Pacearchaeota archaeon]
MEFCPKCGCVLVAKKKNYGCPRCNYSAKSKIKIEASEKINVKPDIGIIDDKQTDIFPKVNATCPNCDNKEAYFWTSQTRAGDEAETRFYKCTKCKRTWREYH